MARLPANSGRSASLFLGFSVALFPYVAAF
jgi:hypothetical protein